jgi:hypothetical protein
MQLDMIEGKESVEEFGCGKGQSALKKAQENH